MRGHGCWPHTSACPRIGRHARTSYHDDKNARCFGAVPKRSLFAIVVAVAASTGVCQPVVEVEKLPEKRVYASKDRVQRDRGDRSEPARGLPGRNAQALLRRAHPRRAERL